MEEKETHTLEYEYSEIFAWDLAIIENAYTINTTQ